MRTRIVKWLKRLFKRRLRPKYIGMRHGRYHDEKMSNDHEEMV